MTVDTSVVVPVYNEEQYVERCLSALAEQTMPGERYEIIVVDDESCDRSQELVSRFIRNRTSAQPAIQYVRLEHGGLSLARNEGIRRSRGSYIAFIDGDAVADPAWLETLIAPLREPTIRLTGGMVRILNPESRFAMLTHRVHYDTPRTDVSCVIGTNMAYHRAIFDEQGGFFGFFEKRGDESTVNRLLAMKHEFAFVPGAIVLHERPTRLGDWLRMRYENGLFGAVSKIVTERRSQVPLAAQRRRRVVTSVNRILNVIFWPLLLLSLVSANTAALALTLSAGVAVLVRYLLRGSIAGLLKHLVSYRPLALPELVLGVPLFVLGYFFDDLGWLKGDRLGRRVSVFSNNIEPRPVLVTVSTETQPAVSTAGNREPG